MVAMIRRPHPDAVLERFRLGQDTVTIADILGFPEHVIARLLESALDLEYAEKHGRFDLWNSALEPVEQRHGDHS